MRLRALRALWWVLRKCWAFDTMAKLRCDGSAAADCWIPAGGGHDGYYRSGILRQYCDLRKDHEGLCLAPINEWGQPVPGGSRFKPEIRRWHS